MRWIAVALTVCAACRSHFDDRPDAPIDHGTGTDAHLPAADLSAHAQGGCVRATATGTITCWGRGDVGEIGDGLVHVNGSEPVTIGMSAATIVTGEHSACSTDASGVARCWGGNDELQLGDGIAHVPPYSTSPVTVAGSSRYSEIAIGQYHACAVTTAGGVDCWGRGSCGRLGTGDALDRPTPTAVAVANVAHIAVDDNASCALHHDGTLTCWGTITADGACHDELSLPVDVPFPGHLVAQVEGGCHETMCVRLDNGTLACWGTNFNGSLGTGTSDSQAMPTKLDGLPPALDFGVGATNGCARTTDGVWCWGANNFGQLGIGDIGVTGSYSPVRVPWFDTMPPPDQIDVGCETACATVDDVVYCWGSNQLHELADGGASMMSTSPTRATSLTP